VNRCWSE